MSEITTLDVFREEFEEDDSEVEDSEEEQEDMEDYKKGGLFLGN